MSAPTKLNSGITFQTAAAATTTAAAVAPTVTGLETSGAPDVGLGSLAARKFLPVVRAIGMRGKAADRLRRLRAVILLDGAVRSSPFAGAIGRSILELPVSPEKRLVDMWRHEVGQLAGSLSGGLLPCRILVGRSSRAPVLLAEDRDAGLATESDPAELRGTGGVLRDAAQCYGDDDVLLVANAAQLLVEPLHQVVAEAAARGGDVTLVGNADGTPASLLLLTCRALRGLPEIGFVDLKEQGLPMIAARHEVTVLTRTVPGGLPIRTPRDYLGAVQAHHRRALGRPVRRLPFAEHGDAPFSLIEPGAQVARDAVVHNSVVLEGGRVDAAAVVADSVVCGGGIARRREHVVRRLVKAGGSASVDAD